MQGRLCSGCQEKHPVDGRPCLKCFPVWRCPKCNKVNRSTRFSCAECHFKFIPDRKTLKKMVHPETMWNCPKCGRKLRAGPRDKRRSMKLKR